MEKIVESISLGIIGMHLFLIKGSKIQLIEVRSWHQLLDLSNLHVWRSLKWCRLSWFVSIDIVLWRTAKIRSVWKGS